MRATRNNVWWWSTLHSKQIIGMPISSLYNVSSRSIVRLLSSFDAERLDGHSHKVIAMKRHSNYYRLRALVVIHQSFVPKDIAAVSGLRLVVFNPRARQCTKCVKLYCLYLYFSAFLQLNKLSFFEIQVSKLHHHNCVRSLSEVT